MPRGVVFMSDKSRFFLGGSVAALVFGFVARHFPQTPWNDLADFATGLATGLLVGMLFTWKRHPPTHV
jgi:hypothetical protein